MNCPFVIKICTKCKRLLVANKINFAKGKKGKWGLQPKCKVCNKKYRKNNKLHYKEYNKRYREHHSKELSEKGKIYRENNKEQIAEYKREWYKNNKEKLKEYKQNWAKDNPEKVFNATVRKRKIKENQGDGITKEQWIEMMIFFEWKCAYSGISLNKNNRTIDHIKPLSLGGEHEIWNCVPMYMPYNSSKYTKDMIEWYKEQEFYSKERLNKIYEWVEYAKNKYRNS